MMELSEYKTVLEEKGVVKIEGFFNKKLCQDFLEKNKTVLYNTVNPMLPGNENNSSNLKIGNEFYGKKKDCWEIFKLNLEEKDVVGFVDGLNVLNLGNYKSSQLVIHKNFLTNVLPCHIDNLFDENITYYNCGIYLTDTKDKDRVYFVENTHKVATKEYTFKENGLNKTYIDAKIGDLIIHNSYVWHGSDNNDCEGRTTLYIKYQK